MKKDEKSKLFESEFDSAFDPFGSYTGSPSKGEYETPVQDADDL